MVRRDHLRIDPTRQLCADPTRPLRLRVRVLPRSVLTVEPPYLDVVHVCYAARLRIEDVHACRACVLRELLVERRLVRERRGDEQLVDDEGNQD